MGTFIKIWLLSLVFPEHHSVIVVNKQDDHSFGFWRTGNVHTSVHHPKCW